MSQFFDQHLSDTRLRLLRPSRASLSDIDLATYVIQVLDQLVIDLNSTGEPWFLQSVPVDVMPGTGVYPITAPNFGRARYLYTRDDANTSHNRRPIRLVSYEELTERFGGGDSLPTSVAPYAGWHSASAASVYYLNEAPGPGNVIDFGEIPDQAVGYTLVFEPDVVRPQNVKDQGFRLQQFDGYVAALSALKALPHCEWQGVTEDRAFKRKADITTSCVYDIGSLQTRRGYAWQFWCFMQSSTQRSEPTVIGWAENRW